MGRKKKPFIDKKRAQTFSLVPRSQKDPLHDDPDEAQYVLKQVKHVEDVGSSTDTTDRLTEQQKYGIYFDDDYDYLQHLKEPGATVLEPVGGDTLQPAGGKKALLPEELFGSEVDVQGHDQKVLPISGPQPGWDPDIVAALEAAECTNSVDEELEDDFVTMANGGEAGLPVYVTEHLDVDGGDSDSTPWWAERGNFSHPGLGPPTADGDRSDVSDEGRSDMSSGGVGRQGLSSQKRAAQFTEYSITSSVVPRSEALTLLDDRFEQFMVGYEDDQLGAPEEDEEEEELNFRVDEKSGRGKGGAMDRCDFDKLLLESAVEDFERNFADQLQQSGESSDEDGTDSASDQEEVPELVHAAPNTTSQDTHKVVQIAVDCDVGEEEEEEGESDREDRVLIEVDERPREKWDCESILSTYSNLYNHPTRISEPVDTTKKQVKLSRKTGIPLGVVPGPERKTDHQTSNKVVSVARPKQESKEEKRVRKQALKQERRLRRAEKKATKMAFKSEELKLERTLAGQLQTALVV